jgi:hypothetical protein
LFTSVNSPILACNVFTSIVGSAGSLWLSDPKTPAAPSSSWPSQIVIWLGVSVELLRQLGPRLLALRSSQSDLRLEGRTMVPAGSLRHLIFCSAAMLAAFRQKLHLAACPDLPSHLSSNAIESFEQPGVVLPTGRGMTCALTEPSGP